MTITMDVRMGENGHSPPEIKSKNQKYVEILKSAAYFPNNWFNSCHDSFICRYDAHTAQEPGSQLRCRAVMSLQFTHVPSFACRGRYKNCERIVLLLVFIT